MPRIKLGIIREGKMPHDLRVALSPSECIELIGKYPDFEIYVQSSSHRGFTDSEYSSLGIPVVNDISHCDVLFGIKEVPVENLIPDKTYFFFSHTIKKQPYNKNLLQTVLKKNITLIDYECLTYPNKQRVIAFGRFAGIVGAYNGFYTWGKKFRSFNLKRVYQCKDLIEIKTELNKISVPKINIILTGGGRVASGAMEILNALKIKKVTPSEFLKSDNTKAVYTLLEPQHYARRKDKKIASLSDYISYPKEYETNFLQYAQKADMYLACHFWDNKAPAFFTKEDVANNDFRIKVIADISCDINGPIPTTLRSTTIADPIFGYNPITGIETDFMNEDALAVMSVDNLPCELPRDSSEYFGSELIKNVLHYLIGEDTEKMLERATIVRNGKLTEKYKYLEDYVNG